MHSLQWGPPQTSPRAAARLQIYLAVDADNAGSNLAIELARRLNRPRCKITVWPTDWASHLVYMDQESVLKKIQDYEKVRIGRGCRAGAW
jgi:hypothetical protein